MVISVITDNLEAFQNKFMSFIGGFRIKWCLFL